MTTEGAIKKLKRSGLVVYPSGSRLFTRPYVLIPRKKERVGIGLWGVIDFLCNYCGYVWVRE